MPFDGLPDLQIGDIVFIQIGGPLFARVAMTSCGWVSHVGIIIGRERGQWMVAESAVPVSRVTSLERFLRRSVRGQFAIKRLKSGLSPTQAKSLQAAVRRRMGRIYDFGFNLDAPRSSFCSKFVYQVVEESTGQRLGTIDRFFALLEKNPRTPIWFWKLWFFGRIPWQRATVTPQSQFASPLLGDICQYP